MGGGGRLSEREQREMRRGVERSNGNLPLRLLCTVTKRKFLPCTYIHLHAVNLPATLTATVGLFFCTC